MKHASLLFFTAPLLGSLLGCNALLGNDESVNANGEEGKTSRQGSDDTATPSKDAASSNTTKGGDDGGTSPHTRDDSKAPCASCSATLVAKGANRARSIRVDKTHVYFSDSLGVHRIARAATPCLQSECLDHLWSKSSYSGFELASDIDRDQMCWIGQQTFGCTDTSTLVNKTVSLDSINVSSSITGLQIFQGKAYAIYDANRRTLGTATAASLATGTGQFGNTVTTTNMLDGFTVNETHLAWEEGDNASNHRIFVRALSGSAAIEIKMPADATKEYTRNLALWNDRVYFSRAKAVYVAPIDGSAEAVPLASFHQPGQLIVSALGVIAAVGGDNANSDNGVEWSPLLPEPAGKALRVATRLASSNEVVPSVAVSEDAIYYSVAPFSGDSGAGVWKIPLE